MDYINKFKKENKILIYICQFVFIIKKKILKLQSKYYVIKKKINKIV